MIYYGKTLSSSGPKLTAVHCFEKCSIPTGLGSPPHLALNLFLSSGVRGNMTISNDQFTQKLYGQGQFKYSIDQAELPAGFVNYHKGNFSKYFCLPENEFAGKRILDTGAGPCKHATVLALMGGEVMATDLTPINIEKGEALKAFYKLGNINFRVHDMMREVDFVVPYDLASAHNWMQHAENPSRVLMNLSSAVHIGGRIYLSLYHGGTFRFFIAQIARTLLKKDLYEPMRNLVRYAFPTGFKEFGNALDIYMENIFDDFFVPYCHTTTYNTVIHDAALLGLKPISEVPVIDNLSGLDNIPLRIGLEKVSDYSVSSAELRYTQPVNEFLSDRPSILQSVDLANQVIRVLEARGDVASICCFCLGLYRIRAQTNASTDVDAKHSILQQYLLTCLDDELRNISFFYDAQKLHASKQ